MSRLSFIMLVHLLDQLLDQLLSGPQTSTTEILCRGLTLLNYSADRVERLPSQKISDDFCLLSPISCSETSADLRHQLNKKLIFTFTIFHSSDYFFFCGFNQWQWTKIQLKLRKYKNIFLLTICWNIPKHTQRQCRVTGHTHKHTHVVTITHANT